MWPLLLISGVLDWASLWDVSDPVRSPVAEVWEHQPVDFENLFEDIEQLSKSHKIENKAAKPKRQILYFTATWCGPCTALKASSYEWLKSGGWAIDTKGLGHIREVDYDTNLDLVSKYGIDRVPTLILIETETGKEIRRVIPQSRDAFVNLYNN